MRRFFCIFPLLFFIFQSKGFSQVTPQFLGLENREVTSLSIYDNIVAVGTDHHGVYWQFHDTASDTGWNPIGLDSLRVLSVFAHGGFGPVGWIVSAGVEPNPGSNDYIFCSLVGQPFFSNSIGIQDTMTNLISELDGYSVPSICGETFAAGGRILYRRQPDDTVWTPVYTATIEGDIQTVRVHDEYPDVVLAGGVEGFAGHLLIKSLDKGETWENISPNHLVVDVDFAGDSAQTIFTANQGPVFRSTDAGDSWTEVFNGQGWIHITEVIYIPPSLVYIAGGDGIDSSSAILFYSVDLGENFQQVSLTMPGPIVDLEPQGTEWIYFATSNSGIFRFQPGILRIDNPPSPAAGFQLFQNYPNPFNPATTIRYRLPATGNVVVTIYNTLGQKVRTLVLERQQAGVHEVIWDGKDGTGRVVGSGVYFYRLQAGEFTKCRKMLMLR